MTPNRFLPATSAATAILLAPRPAAAGMPSLMLSDLARMRLDTLSFFLLGGLVSAAIIREVWNSLRLDFPAWPKLSYRGALCATFLWGLLSMLILTMISGARELLTPGAWKKEGLTYTLAAGADSAKPATGAATIDVPERKQSLERLMNALWAEAGSHSSEFPESMEASQFSDEFWRQPGSPATRYIYRSGLRMSRQGQPLVIEQQIDDATQFVLFTDGAIRSGSPEDVSQWLSAVSTLPETSP